MTGSMIRRAVLTGVLTATGTGFVAAADMATRIGGANPKKLQESVRFVSVKDFDTIGDGVADDTVKILPLF